MAVRTKEEILESLKNRLGEDTSDDALELLEDITDTYEDLNNRAASYNELESKYNELDASWRTRYKERFYMATGSNDITDDPIPEIDEPAPDEILTFDGLFTEVK